MKITYKYNTSPPSIYGPTQSTCDANIDLSPHPAVVAQALTGIINLFNLRDVGEKPHHYLKQAENHTDTNCGYLDLNEDFAAALDSLCQKKLLSSEAEYIKAQPVYQKFLASSLLKDITGELTSFFSKGRWDRSTTWVVTPADVDRCLISHLYNTDTKTFSLELHTRNHDSDAGMYEHASFPYEKKYRVLSITEISMLAVALADKFPRYFTYTWGIYNHWETKKSFLGKDKDSLVFDMGLVPKYITNLVTSNDAKHSTILDIY